MQTEFLLRVWEIFFWECEHMESPERWSVHYIEVQFPLKLSASDFNHLSAYPRIKERNVRKIWLVANCNHPSSLNSHDWRGLPKLMAFWYPHECMVSFMELCLPLALLPDGVNIPYPVFCWILRVFVPEIHSKVKMCSKVWNLLGLNSVELQSSYDMKHHNLKN